MGLSANGLSALTYEIGSADSCCFNKVAVRDPECHHHLYSHNSYSPSSLGVVKSVKHVANRYARLATPISERAENAIHNHAGKKEWQEISQDAKDEKAVMELHGRPKGKSWLGKALVENYDNRMDELNRVISLADSRIAEAPRYESSEIANDNNRSDADRGLPRSTTTRPDGTRVQGTIVEGAGGRSTVDAPATNDSSEATLQESTADIQAKARARAIIDISMNKEITANDSDDFIRDNITPEILKYASASEKSHMLLSLMDGKTGEGDEQAMLLILDSVKSGSEMKEVLNGAGGAYEVMNELEEKAPGFMDGLKAGGKEGAEKLLAVLTTYDAEGSRFESFLEHSIIDDAITPEILENASAQDKAILLDKLMAGKTTGRSEDSMLMILQSIDTKAEMDQVIAAAGGDARVMDELEEKAYPLYKNLS